MGSREIPYYVDYISDGLLARLRSEATPVVGVAGLAEVGPGGGLENPAALRFLCELYDAVKVPLNEVLRQRGLDRKFIDQRTRACYELNKKLGIDFLDENYATILGHEDGRGRVVMGPRDSHYCRPGGAHAPVAPLPPWLQGPHVTLFGPPDDPKLSINAMNAVHRKLPGEPAIVEELVQASGLAPKWGADDEDSKTPLRADLIAAGENLSGCFAGTLAFKDERTGKEYRLAEERRAHSIKRFPGLALPATFLLYQGQPLPLHLYDFALHLFRHWDQPAALSFYVPKLETEEEARYVHQVMATAEELVRRLHPEYRPGTVRLFVVLENPRAIFRAHEIMDALHPYFAGASLGWHDYLASTARIFKEDANYRIPVKADPDIVIKYIKASHDLLADVVGPRGGVKIGGMYGVLPMDGDLASPSFQVTIKGFIRDVVTQLKRDLSGFWVAHPDFVRVGIALVEAWRRGRAGDPAPLEQLVRALLEPIHQDEILAFVRGPDLIGLDPESPRYARSLIVADIRASDFIANNHPDEVRYNVFQSLQYLTDWLTGNGCVALPAQIAGVPVRVMDDLATAERSRWEVWAEIHHGRFPAEELVKIMHEELTFIRKDLSDARKIVQVKWSERTAKWYPVAAKLMLKLMTAAEPPEFATELLMPFTVESIRAAADPYGEAAKLAPGKYEVEPFLERLSFAFGALGNLDCARALARGLSLDLEAGAAVAQKLDLAAIVAAAAFHGDIGESRATLDDHATREQALVFQEEEATKTRLRALGREYREKFGVKFLVSAQGKTGAELLALLETRLHNTSAQELEHARAALWEIALKRLKERSDRDLRGRLLGTLLRHGVKGAQVTVCAPGPDGVTAQDFHLGERDRDHHRVGPRTRFEIASLSKTIASCCALEFFRARGIALATPVNQLLAGTASKFRLSSDAVTIEHLMTHTALNLHYVNGVPASETMPPITEFLTGNARYGYEPIAVVHPPGTVFQYSGGGFLVLEHLLEALAGTTAAALTRPFLERLGLRYLTFDPAPRPDAEDAHGYLADGTEVAGTRKMFPAFAAGALGTTADLARFLTALTRAFRDVDGADGISHDTAVRMLHGRDLGSREFMGADMGIGVFVTEAGPNRLLLHQGANDGFRCLFVHCFDGPNAGEGFSVLCNGDANGVLFVADAARALLDHLGWIGIDPAGYGRDFDSARLPPEQIVNLAYKDLIFGAFAPALPEAIAAPGPADPLARYNRAVGGKILAVTNQKFARAENLLSRHLPAFDPELFGAQGKIMDSWETVRHNVSGRDVLVFELRQPSAIKYATFSTQFHLGNQAPKVALEGFSGGSWIGLVPEVSLDGHALKRVKTTDCTSVCTRVRVTIFPDGGLSRLQLFDDGLPSAEKIKFLPPDMAPSQPFEEKIPHALKPLAPKFATTAEEIAARLEAPGRHDLASAAYGGRIVSASNEHYGPAVQVISPYPPLHMFDGFESARSREPGHREEIVIALGRAAVLARIEIDFTYFRNNNPRFVDVQGLSGASWVPLVPLTETKPYAGNRISFTVRAPEKISQVKLGIFPDGGLNRVHVYARET